MQTKNKFSLVKDKVLDNTSKETPLPKRSKPEVMPLFTERERATLINKEK